MRKKMTRKRLALAEKDRRHKLFKILLPLSIVLLIVVVFHFKIEDFFLRRFGVCTTAIVTRDKEYHRYDEDTFVFAFSTNDKLYTGDSWESDKKLIGDTIPIVYLKIYPGLNRPVNGWFEGRFDCSY